MATTTRLVIAVTVLALSASAWLVPLRAQTVPGITVSGADLGGLVSGPRTPKTSRGTHSARLEPAGSVTRS